MPTGKRGNVEVGRVVNLDEGWAAGEVPIHSVFAWCPHGRREPFTGDPAPVLALLAGAAEPAR